LISPLCLAETRLADTRLAYIGLAYIGLADIWRGGLVIAEV
jgi:hypothetical protein